MRIGLGMAALSLLVVASAPAWALCDKPKPVQFAAGSSGGEIAGSVIRGDRDCYTIGARGGQSMSVQSLVRGESNAALQICQPGWKVGRDRDGWVFTGKTLPRAGEEDDAPSWAGTLPANGSYLLVVGPVRGNASYRLRIEIR